MSPGDFLLFVLYQGFAALSLLAHGWGVNGIGPAAFATAAGLWQLWRQWLRHRSWLRHQEEGFAPGTQHLAISAAVGWFLGIGAAVLWTMLFFLKGEASVGLGNDTQEAQPGTWVHRPAGLKHSIRARTLLVLLK